MDKRYQVFVSSTFADLKEERRAVIETLIKVDCIPAGMELFPASDEAQFDFIKRVINDCDYYLVIIGGRYGSVTPEGVSYTEKEYDYALERGLKVIALLHGAPGDIPAKHTEKSEEGQRRLEAFREKVKTGRLVDFWTTPEQLQAKVALAMVNAIRTFPAVGWVRANRSASEDVLADINELRKENQQLRTALAQHAPPVLIDDIAAMDEEFNVYVSQREFRGGREVRNMLNRAASWEWLFAMIAPSLENTPNESLVRSTLAEALFPGKILVEVDQTNMETIRTQFQALGLIKVHQANTVGAGIGLFWTATEKGQALGLQLRSVRSARTARS